MLAKGICPTHNKKRQGAQPAPRDINRHLNTPYKQFKCQHCSYYRVNPIDMLPTCSRKPMATFSSEEVVALLGC